MRQKAALWLVVMSVISTSTRTAYKTTVFMGVTAKGDDKEIKIYFETGEGMTITIDAIKVLGTNLNKRRLKLTGDKVAKINLRVEQQGQVIGDIQCQLSSDGQILLEEVSIKTISRTAIKVQISID